MIQAPAYVVLVVRIINLQVRVYYIRDDPAPFELAPLNFRWKAPQAHRGPLELRHTKHAMSL
jgi:hypothetical protein